MSRIELEEPRWGEIKAEVMPLAEQHYQEVDGGVEPKRKFLIDDTVMEQMDKAGLLKIIVARVDGFLAGYISWTVTYDPESKGLLIANMGPWFVLPEYAKNSLGHKMMDKSLSLLRDLGVQMIYPHHRLQGRGSDLGAYFLRLGAKPIQMTYSLWIGK